MRLNPRRLWRIYVNVGCLYVPPCDSRLAQNLLKAAFHLLAMALPMLCFAMVPPASAQTEPAPQRLEQKYFYLFGGSFSPEKDRQLGDENGKLTLGLGFGSRYSPHIAWEIEIPFHYRSANAPDLSSIFLTLTSGRADISTFGLAGNVRLIYPGDRFEPYLGGGFGLYYTNLEVTRFVVGFPGSFRTSDINVGLQMLAGVDYFYGEKGRSVGLQYRKLKLDANFGPEVPGSVKVGGDALLLNLRWSF
jgi:opacity protein-like surface antigen